MIKIKHQGSFAKIERFFKGVVTSDYVRILEKYGSQGVAALMAATPVDTGKTVSSWAYEIRHHENGASIVWTNDNMADRIPIVILLQYGHATGSGGYVQGQDFINPALRPIFDKIARDLWGEVTKR